MESTGTPPPEELLQFHPTYRVLICQACRYAIQPTGIARHLKEIHHIYRSHRRPYVDYASRFKLADPQYVIQTEIIEFPVRLLPVLDGLQCTAATGCGFLCASTKRMQKHWLSVHGRHGNADNDWHSTPLQTFFRGNLLHYFTDPRPQCTKETATRDGKLAGVVRRLDGLDQKLLHHYITSTSLSLVDVHGTQAIWQQTIPEMACEHPFLMHSLLACSALHLAHQFPSDINYLVRGLSHQDIAMQLFRHAIEHVTKSSCHSILAYCHLLVINSFAANNTDERLLLVNPSSPHPDMLCSWLYFTRNICVLVCDLWDCIEAGPLNPLISCWETDVPEHDATDSAVTRHLLNLVATGADEDGKVTEACREAARQLGSAIEAANLTRAGDFNAWDVVRVWPLQISTEFIQLLAREHPMSMVILAHYGWLLDKANRRWFLENRAKTLFNGVLDRLDLEWQSRLRRSFETIKALS